jgi:hypothetical protein
MPFQFRKEAIEEDLNSNFPSQGQGNPPLYYSLSEVVVPTYSINTVAEGSSLPESLQQAWDSSTGNQLVSGASNVSLITNTGFWLVDLNYSGNPLNVSTQADIEIFDGTTRKPIWRVTETASAQSTGAFIAESRFVVFLRTGDSLRANVPTANRALDVWYRQIATVNGQLVNPLGFSFA